MMKEQAGVTRLIPTLVHALGYAARGVPVLPLHSIDDAGACTCGRPECSHPGKHPRTRDGLLAATTDTEQIERWWTEFPSANLGVRTGMVSGIVALDIDVRHGGYRTLAELEQRNGALPQTVAVSTGGGGKHYYFRHPGGRVSSGPLGKDLPGIDVKADGGYVVAPLSLHASGERYRWEPGLGLGETAIADMPEWLHELVGSRRSDGRAVVKPVPESFSLGQRNVLLTSLAGTMRRRGMGEEAILAALLVENEARCDPPLPKSEVEGIAEGILRYDPAKKDYHRTDQGNAQRLVDLFGRIMRFCPTMNKWLIWDERRWAIDTTLEVERLAIETVKLMWSEASYIENQNERDSFIKFVLRSENEKSIRAMVKMAQSNVAVVVRPEQLNTNRWLLNCLNGTVDLRTGKLKPHDPADLITRLAPVEYRPDDYLDMWGDFLWTATGGDQGMIAFLQRAAGYSLTGDISEEKMFFVHGPGATGKSTFLEALKATMGEYAVTSPVDTFLAKRNDGGPRNDIARLDGARLAVTVEVAQGKSLAEALVKTITGGDKVTARFLYKEHFEFLPEFKLWMPANDPPKVRDDADAIWRRILRVPFDKIIPEKDRDPKIKTTLKDPSVAGPAILAWAVKGCLAWQQDGLGVPPVVKEATEELRHEMDPLQGFIEEYCSLERDAWTPAAELRQVYEDWARQNGETPVTLRSWGDRLRARGCERGMRGNPPSRGWKGIKLTASALVIGVPSGWN